MVTATLAIGVAWIVERTRKPEILYLHVYNSTYPPEYDAISAPPALFDSKLPRNTRIATIAISPDIPFHAAIPNNYLPAMQIEGELSLTASAVSGSLRIDVEAPDAAFDFDYTTPIVLETVVPFWEPFNIVISRSSDPYEFPEEIKQTDL